jgi:hypothetical protein
MRTNCWPAILDDWLDDGPAAGRWNHFDHAYASGGSSLEQRRAQLGVESLIMPAYVIGRIQVTDPQRYSEYMKVTPGIIASASYEARKLGIYTPMPTKPVCGCASSPPLLVWCR